MPAPPAWAMDSNVVRHGTTQACNAEESEL
jgi:hypothetical protein